MTTKSHEEVANSTYKHSNCANKHEVDPSGSDISPFEPDTSLSFWNSPWN